MLELGDKTNCDKHDFEDFLTNYQATFLISKKYSYLTYIGIFNDEKLDYSKFDEKAFTKFYSRVYIPFMM